MNARILYMNHRLSGQLRTLALLTALACAAGPTLAHHSFAMFDNTRTESISGTVYAFEWSNPHTWLWVDVDDGKGNDVKWGFESAAPSELGRSGWNKHSLNPGDKVTVEFRPLKDGRPGGSLGKVTKSDGTVLGGGAGGGGGPGGAGGPGGPGGPGAPGGAPSTPAPGGK
jgi:hypothetical protein